MRIRGATTNQSRVVGLLNEYVETTPCVLRERYVHSRSPSGSLHGLSRIYKLYGFVCCIANLSALTVPTKVRQSRLIRTDIQHLGNS